MKILNIITLTLLLPFVYLNASESHPYLEPIAVEIAPVFDGDKDGIEDRIDRCPNSELNAVVNSFGCLNEITIVLVDNKKDHNAIVVSTDAGSTLVDKANQFVTLYSQDQTPTKPKDISKDEIENMFPHVATQKEVNILKYTLYFEEIDALNTSSKEKFLSIIKSINDNKNAIITISGHTDTLGSSAFNEKLSQKRVDFVTNALKENGIEYLNLELNSLGESDLAVKTADNTLEPLNRRVEILIR